MNEQGPTHPEAKKQSRASKFKAVLGALDWLKAHFPEAFLNSSEPKPLKMGITQDIFRYFETHPGIESPSRGLTRKAIRFYVNRIGYLNASSTVGNRRVGLDGCEQGAITAPQAEYAIAQLATRGSKKRTQSECKSSQTSP